MRGRVPSGLLRTPIPAEPSPQVGISGPGRAPDEELRTVEEMPRLSALSNRPLLRTTVTETPTTLQPRVAARKIAKVDVTIVAPAIADPAVLVSLSSEHRLWVKNLFDRTGVRCRRWLAVSVATGCIELAPLDGDDSAAGALGVVTIDAQCRMRLPVGLVRRLAVRIADNVLVTASPDGTRMVLLKPGTRADLLAAATATDPDDPATEETDR